MEKIVAKAKTKPMLKIGEDLKSSRWYFLDDKVKEYVYDKLTAEDVKAGVEVTEMRTEKKQGKEYIVFMKVNKSDVKEEAVVEQQETKEAEDMQLPDTSYQSKGYYKGKSPLERADIRSQAIGHMTSRVISQLVGSIPEIKPEEVENWISIVYDAFVAKVDDYREKERS